MGAAGDPRPHDEFAVPTDWPGHSMALTLMRNPYMYRAECICGWWVDTFELAEGQRVARNHKLNSGGMQKWANGQSRLRLKESASSGS